MVVCASSGVGQSHFPGGAAQAAPRPSLGWKSSSTPPRSVPPGVRGLEGWAMPAGDLEGLPEPGL